MVCLPQAGYVTKYGEKLTALGGILGYWPLRRGAAAAAKKAELGFYAPFLCWRLSEKTFGERGEEWGFLDQRGVSWNF